MSKGKSNSHLKIRMHVFLQLTSHEEFSQKHLEISLNFRLVLLIHDLCYKLFGRLIFDIQHLKSWIQPFRNSHSLVFYKKPVLKKFANYQENSHAGLSCRSGACHFIKKKNLTQTLSCKFCKNFQNSIF